MISPDQDTWRQLAQIRTAQGGLNAYVQEWYMRELKQLPMSVNNTAVQQGRCQVLAELSRLFDDAPNTARQR